MKRIVLTLVPVLALAGGLTSATVHGDEDASKPAYYTSQVKPIFDASCAKCHMGVNQRGGLSMETREGMITGGHHGTALVPGDPSKSLLLTLIKHQGPADDPMDMPPHADKLSDAQIAVIEKWIKAGAVMPPAAAPAAQ
jgi:mono/diheme cytochrome c family protein